MTKPVIASPTVLDRVVSWFDPVRGARRLAARQAFAMMAGPVGGVSRSAGSRKGRLSTWLPKRLRRVEEDRERDTAMDRAEDLVANDGLAASATSSLALNVVGGPGIRPQSRPAYAALGITEGQADAFASSAEAAFELWSASAGVDGAHFSDIQYLLLHSTVALGEFCQIPLMRQRPGAAFDFCLQTIHPARLRTPYDLAQRGNINQGVELADGAPMAYWVADPPDGMTVNGLTSTNFKRYDRYVGYRPGFFHGFLQDMPERVRGVSVLSPGSQLFRHHADYLDYSLMQAIVTASLAVFVETEDPFSAAMRMGRPLDGRAAAVDEEPRHQELSPGMFMYGRPGDRPHIIESKNPPPAFDAFVKRVARGIAASTGQPYEVVARDFSETNYSSARAALLEVWKLYRRYHAWFVRSYCQSIWEMVLEEAWLLGMLAVPASAPDYWTARHLWCACAWTPPARGYVDPVKEVTANILALDNNLTTLADLAAEQGKDWEDITRQRSRERSREAELKVEPRGKGAEAHAATPTTREEDKR